MVRNFNFAATFTFEKGNNVRYEVPLLNFNNPCRTGRLDSIQWYGEGTGGENSQPHRECGCWALYDS